MVCGSFIVIGIVFMLYFYFPFIKNVGCSSAFRPRYPNIYYRTKKIPPISAGFFLFYSFSPSSQIRP